MKINHYAHEHPLVFSYQKNVKCNGCNERMNGPTPTYSCSISSCNFNLHKFCFQLPLLIHTPHTHPHLLRLLLRQSRPWKCSICKVDYTSGFFYCCYICNFTIDPRCLFIGSFLNHRLETLQKTGIVSMKHSIHEHLLVRDDNSFEYPELAVCAACQLPLSTEGSIYFCNLCIFTLHKTCLDKIPEKELHHHYHDHHLHPEFKESMIVQCAACRTTFQGIALSCNECRFYLHLKCFDLRRPSLKHKCHKKHPLEYFLTEEASVAESDFLCNICDASCAGSFYRCVKCDENFHFECMRLPREVTLEYHRHKPLQFTEVPIRQGYADGEYCDACESSRKPEYAAYYCEECPFTAHIACVMAEEGKTLKVLSHMVPKYEKSLEHFTHGHRLTFLEETEGNDHRCRGCNKKILDSHYCCKRCIFCLHKSCAELPFEKLDDPSHSQHPLFLTCSNSETWTCNKCHEQSIGFFYRCGRCTIFIHFDCQFQKEEELDWERWLIEIDRVFLPLEKRNTEVIQKDWGRFREDARTKGPTLRLLNNEVLNLVEAFERLGTTVEDAKSSLKNIREKLEAV